MIQEPVQFAPVPNDRPMLARERYARILRPAARSPVLRCPVRWRRASIADRHCVNVLPMLATKATPFCNAPTRLNGAPGFVPRKRTFLQVSDLFNHEALPRCLGHRLGHLVEGVDFRSRKLPPVRRMMTSTVSGSLIVIDEGRPPADGESTPNSGQNSTPFNSQSNRYMSSTNRRYFLDRRSFWGGIAWPRFD